MSDEKNIRVTVNSGSSVLVGLLVFLLFQSLSSCGGGLKFTINGTVNTFSWDLPDSLDTKAVK